ncbi:unnamed protein product [Allacma fusca]|uniref:Uncharacterized protein n=1 Tax=Allacma fusca TaxID=39272 RepID=A0A8J2JYN0_9HEXA|nr:unnamed protein product [Allacma fusca]
MTFTTPGIRSWCIGQIADFPKPTCTWWSREMFVPTDCGIIPPSNTSVVCRTDVNTSVCHINIEGTQRS